MNELKWGLLRNVPELNIDLRELQVLALSWFLLLGIITHRFDSVINFQMIVAAILTSLGVQYLASFVLQRKENLELISRSALITGLGLCLLLRTNSLAIMGLAAVCAILSKFLIKYRGKHLFNPANFGIIAVLGFTNQAWVSPGQWGDSFLIALLFMSVGGLILSWLGRWETTVIFLFVYSLEIAVRNAWLGFGVETFWHQLNSGSLLLFAFFMISDPRSIPDGKGARIIWSSLVALLTFILKYQFFIATAPFLALFFCSFLTPLFDRVLPGKRFNWLSTIYSLGDKKHETANI